MTETIQIWSGEAELYADTRPAPPSILLDICTRLVHTSNPTLVVDLQRRAQRLSHINSYFLE